MRTVTCLLAAALLGAAGCAWDERSLRATATDLAPVRGPNALYGLLFDESFGRPELARLGRLTLHPSGRSLAVGSAGGGFAYSPNRSRVALGTDLPPGIELVRLGRLRRDGSVRFPPNRFAGALAWPAPRALYAALHGEREATVVRVDPVKRRIVARFDFLGQIAAAAATTDGLALLLAPPDAIGPLRLVIVDANGARGVDLTVEGGWEAVGGSRNPVVRHEIPGLAIDPAGERAAVVPAGRTVVTIDLATLAVRYHALDEPRSFLTRVRDWIEPPAEAKIVEGSTRQAVWLADRLLAVTGVDYEPRERDHEPIATAAGLTFVDLAGATVRVVDRDVSTVARASRTLLAYGAVPRSRGGRAPAGITGYDAQGGKRFTALGDEPVDDVRVAGRYAYVASAERNAFSVLDLGSGRVVAAPRTGRPTMLLGEP